MSLYRRSINMHLMKMGYLNLVDALDILEGELYNFESITIIVFRVVGLRRHTTFWATMLFTFDNVMVKSVTLI